MNNEVANADIYSILRCKSPHPVEDLFGVPAVLFCVL